MSPALGLLDLPGGPRRHETPVPKVGGLVLISSLLIVSLFRGFSLPFTRAELACILCMTVVGFVDDLHDLGEQVRGLGSLRHLRAQPDWEPNTGEWT